MAEWRLKDIADKFFHGFGDETDFLGRPITSDPLHRVLDTANFKVSTALSILNGVAAYGVSQGNALEGMLAFAATFAGAALVNSDTVALREQTLSTSDIVNKKPTQADIEKYGAQSHAQALIYKEIEEYGTMFPSFGLAAAYTATANVLMAANASLDDSSSAASLTIGALYAFSGQESAFSAREGAYQDRLNRLVQKEWLLQPPGSQHNKSSKRSFFGKVREYLEPVPEVQPV